MLIRQLQPDDSQQFVELNLQLSKETDRLLLMPEEVCIDVERQRDIILNMNTENNRVVYIAVQDNAMVGFIGATKGIFSKNKHTCHLMVGVLEAYWKRGIATKLIKRLESWAGDHNIHRLELTVIVSNTPALSLYQKNGYIIEGTKKSSLYINGIHVDEHIMAKII